MHTFNQSAPHLRVQQLQRSQVVDGQHAAVHTIHDRCPVTGCRGTASMTESGPLCSKDARLEWQDGCQHESYRDRHHCHERPPLPVALAACRPRCSLCTGHHAPRSGSRCSGAGGRGRSCSSSSASIRCLVLMSSKSGTCQSKSRPATCRDACAPRWSDVSHLQLCAFLEQNHHLTTIFKSHARVENFLLPGLSHGAYELTSDCHVNPLPDAWTCRA